MNINHFRREFSFLSNFFPATILVGRKTWLTVEHAFQACKTLDRGEQELIRSASSPALAKRLGKTVTRRADWDERKLRIMHKLVTMKFQQHHRLWCLLINTKPRTLVEGNQWHDNFWGICSCRKCNFGHNHLGHILMRVREELSINPSPLGV